MSLDRGRLINAEASAGASLVEARERDVRLRSNRRASVVDQERARVAVIAAELRKVEAVAALEAIGGRNPKPGSG